MYFSLSQKKKFKRKLIDANITSRNGRYKICRRSYFNIFYEKIADGSVMHR
jgi:hypothetical protein